MRAGQALRKKCKFQYRHPTLLPLFKARLSKTQYTVQSTTQYRVQSTGGCIEHSKKVKGHQFE